MPRRSCADLGCASELVDISPMVDAYFERPTSDATRPPAAARQPHGADPDDGALRPLGDLAGPRRRHRQQDRDAHRLHDAVRRQRLRLQAHRRPLQDARCASCRWRSGVPDAIVRKAPSRRPVARPDRRGRGRLLLREVDRILFRLVDRRRSIDEVVADGFDRATVERVDRMVAGAEFKRQVPPIAKVGPRTAGIDYLYPRRRPRSTRG